MHNNVDEQFNQWKQRPTPNTMGSLVKSLNPTIDKALKTYGYAGDPNMKTTAQLHVMKSLNRFDPQKAKLNTFVFNELKRMQRLGPRQQHAIPIPEQAAYDLKNVQRIESDLTGDLGREPTHEELADAAGLSTRRIKALKTKYSMPTVTEASLDTSRGMMDMPSIRDDEEKERLWGEAVYSGLDPVDKKIMDWSLGWHGTDKRSKTEIAKALGISNPAVTQRAQRIASKLNEGINYEVL